MQIRGLSLFFFSHSSQGALGVNGMGRMDSVHAARCMGRVAALRLPDLERDVRAGLKAQMPRALLGSRTLTIEKMADLLRPG